MNCGTENPGVIKADEGILENVVKDKIYLIPKYQRGYRWTKLEVQKLLYDVFEGLVPGASILNHIKNDSRDTYCIQPLVVIKSGEKETREGTKKVYHVIDGQQRLTTIAIILAAINSYLPMKDGSSKIDIEYESRASSRKYLDLLYSDSSQAEAQKGENIDYEYMYAAYTTAWNFFEENIPEDNKNMILTALRDDILLKKTSFIWYEPELNRRSEQDVFADFNTGKIELTNSELIKAVFMDPARLGGSGKEVKSAQVVISERWDEIENRLRDPELWAFIPHSDEYQYSEDPNEGCTNRIEILFRLFVAKNIGKIFSYTEHPGKNTSQAAILYNETNHVGLYTAVEAWIDSRLNGKTDAEKGDLLRGCWDEITLVFHELLDLYSQNDTYNLAGLYMYLLHEHHPYIERYKKLLDVVNVPRDKRKDTLKELIKNALFKKILKDLDRTAAEAWLKSLRYNKGEAHTRDMKNVLLAYNISMLLDAAANNSRYSFAAYHIQNWSLEHIFAQRTDASKSKTGQNGDESQQRAAEELKRMRKAAVEMLYSEENREEYQEYLTELGEDTENGDTVKAAEKLEKLYKYYQRIDRIEEMLDKPGPAPRWYRMAADYFMDYSDEKDTIRIRFHQDFNALVSALVKKHDGDPDPDPKQLIPGFGAMLGLTLSGLKNTGDTEDEKAANMRKSVVDRFSVARENTLKKLRNDPSQLSAGDYEPIKNLLKLSQTTMEAEINTFFSKPAQGGGDGPEAAQDSRDRSEFARLFNDDSLGNMCLLPGILNTKVGNRPFYMKKEKIEDFISQSKFIPAGTVLVFSGKFSHGVYADNFWLPASRKRYLEDVIDKVCGLCSLEKKEAT